MPSEPGAALPSHPSEFACIDLANSSFSDYLGGPNRFEMFDQLDAANRYAILYRVTTAKRAETRRRRIEQFVTMLARGETIHPQRQRRVPAADSDHHR